MILLIFKPTISLNLVCKKNLHPHEFQTLRVVLVFFLHQRCHKNSDNRQTQFFFFFSIVVQLKRKINSSLTKRQHNRRKDKRCVILIFFSFEGWFWVSLHWTVFGGKEPGVALSLLQTIMTFFFSSFLWWIFCHDISGEKVSLR